MADSDLNRIQAVESLPNIQGLSPARQREERRRQQPGGGHAAPQPEEEPAEKTDEEKPARPKDGPHSIDYCA